MSFFTKIFIEFTFMNNSGLGLSDSKIDEINKNVLKRAKGMESFLNLMIGSLDSRPVFAAVGGFKKECT
jgi:hypothetical protein